MLGCPILLRKYKGRDPMPVQIQTIVSMPFAENTYVAWADGQTDAVVVDPGMEPGAILDFLTGQGLTAVAILNTHGRADHIAGNEAMKAAFPAAPLVIAAGDGQLLTDPVPNVSRSFGLDIVSPPPDRLVREGDTVPFAGLTLDILDIPGHSPGHIVYVARGEGLVFGGDVLFRGGIG